MELLMEQFPYLMYPVLFVVLLIEGAGIPGFPYEFLFLLSGYGVERGELSFAVLVGVGTVGGLVGNLLGYALGKYPGIRWASKLGLPRAGDDLALARARQLLQRYGLLLILISRWLAPLRAPVTLGAGLLKMNLSRYIWASLLGNFLWTLAWQWMGWRASDWLLDRWAGGWRGQLLVAVLGLVVTVVSILVPAWAWRRHQVASQRVR